jgi:cysteinyl-tRNA synthetase
MSMKYLGVPTLDIHAGGRDLIFPHHENEIAQAEALTGKPFAKYWLHHGLLTINGQKMAKSLGNFVTIRDFASSFKNTDILKMFFLSAHYASPLDYTAEKVGEARQALERIIILREKIPCLPVVIKTAAPLEAEIGQARDRFIEAMDDDFNMPRGLACIFELVNTANKNIAEPGFAAAAGELLKELLDIFGISLSPYAETAGLTDAEVEAKIAERNLARRNKDYALSDKIRKELESSGVILEDSKGGATSWRRKV